MAWVAEFCRRMRDRAVVRRLFVGVVLDGCAAPRLMGACGALEVRAAFAFGFGCLALMEDYIWGNPVSC